MYPRSPFRRHGLGITARRIDKIIPRAVTRFYSDSEQMLLVRQPASRAITDGVVGKLSRLPAPVGTMLNGPPLGGLVIAHLASEEIARPRPSPMRTGGDPSVSRTKTV